MDAKKTNYIKSQLKSRNFKQLREPSIIKRDIFDIVAMDVVLDNEAIPTDLDTLFREQRDDRLKSLGAELVKTHRVLAELTQDEIWDGSDDVKAMLFEPRKTLEDKRHQRFMTYLENKKGGQNNV